MRNDDNGIDPVFGPPLVGPHEARPPRPIPVRPPTIASVLVNVTFRVALTDPAASQSDEEITGFTRSAMQSAVLREVTAAPGAHLNGQVQVTANMTRG